MIYIIPIRNKLALFNSSNNTFSLSGNKSLSVFTNEVLCNLSVFIRWFLLVVLMSKLAHYFVWDKHKYL